MLPALWAERGPRAAGPVPARDLAATAARAAVAVVRGRSATELVRLDPSPCEKESREPVFDPPRRPRALIGAVTAGILVLSATLGGAPAPASAANTLSRFVAVLRGREARPAGLRRHAHDTPEVGAYRDAVGEAAGAGDGVDVEAGDRM